jgi:hypothetical protein
MLTRTVGVNEIGRQIGQYRFGAKLTDHEVSLLLGMHTEGLGYKRLAKKFEISIRSVRDMVSLRRRGQTAANWKRVMVGEQDSTQARARRTG